MKTVFRREFKKRETCARLTRNWALHSLPTGPFIHNVFTKRKKLDVSIEAEFNTELLRGVRRRGMFAVPIVCEQFLVFPSWCCFLSDLSGVQCKRNFCVQWLIQQLIFRLQILFVNLLDWLLYPTTWEARWLCRDQAVRVRVLAEAIVLCSWTRHLTLTVPLSTRVYKWVLAIPMLRVNPAMD